jgi:hypothetical protein
MYCSYLNWRPTTIIGIIDSYDFENKQIPICTRVKPLNDLEEEDLEVCCNQGIKSYVTCSILHHLVVK